MPHPKLSVPDSYAYALASGRQWTLLTGDAELRAVAQAEAIPFFGTLWICDRLFEEKVIAAEILADGLATLGDQRWRRFLDDHDQPARQIIGTHRGNLVKTTGDGILATFDGPGRAVRCALTFGEAARQLGLPLRSGLHTGEVEMRGGLSPARSSKNE